MTRDSAHATTNPMAGIDIPASAFTDTARFIDTARKGIAGKIVKQAVEVVGQRDLFVRLVGVSPGNLHRVYRRKTLSPAQSEALLDVLWVFSQASKVFGDLDAAREWLSTPLPALGGECPLDLCDTFGGRRLVREAIAKIEYGEFP